MTKKRKQYPSQARLRELFDYDPNEGLIKKPRSVNSKFDKAWNTRWAGTKASRVVVESCSIRRLATANGLSYSYVDLLWIYFYGEIPKGKHVKSKCGVFENPSVDQLYLSDNMYSKHNGNLTTNNKHGFKGVKVQDSGRYQAILDSKDLGTYAKLEAAAEAWNRAAVNKYGRGIVLNETGCDDPEKYRYTLKMARQSFKMSEHKYRGVMPNRKNWMARIGINGKPKYLGTFKSQEEAARAYNIAAYEHYGEQAVLNDIPDPLGRGDIF